MEFIDVLNSRYSVRDYLDKEVEQEKIDKILKSAQIAPTGKNTQCQQIYVLKSKEAIDKIRSLTKCAFNAPLVFLNCANLDRQCILSKTGKSLKETDVAIVQTYMMLTAQDLGLSTCWVCLFVPDEVKKAFNLPENVEPLNLLLVGYEGENSQINERHFDKLDISETVSYL